MANPVAAESRVEVAGVFHPCQAAAPGEGPQHLPPDAEKWAHPGRPARGDPAQSAEAGASEQVQQDRFGLVVQRVAQEDPGGAGPPRQPAEPDPTKPPGLSFNGASVVVPVLRTNSENGAGNPEIPAPLLDRGGIAGRVRPEGVVDVADEDPPVPESDLVQAEAEKADRIAPARNRQKERLVVADSR